jgi:hypothetical protein
MGTGQEEGVQRRRRRAKNLQVLEVIKNCSSLGYPSAQIEAFWAEGCQGV